MAPSVVNPQRKSRHGVRRAATTDVDSTSPNRYSGLDTQCQSETRDEYPTK